MVEEDRMLVAEVPPLRYEADFALSGGWQKSSANNSLYYETQIDLGGLFAEGMTFFPAGAAVQEGYAFSRTAGTFGGTPMQVYDVVSMAPLSDIEVWNGIPPGFSTSQNNWHSIVWGRHRELFNPQFSTNQATVIFPINSSLIGSGEPTATETLYVYRVVIFATPPSGAEFVEIPPSRFIIDGAVAKEEDLEYIMRLKRGYILATE